MKNNFILKGLRITLRPLVVTDAAKTCRWFKDKEVCRYFNPAIHNISLNNEKKWILQHTKNDKKELQFAIINEKGEHVGNTGFEIDAYNQSVKWGIVIGEKMEWGKGYAGEVIGLVKEYIFRKLSVRRLWMNVEIGNKRAVRAYKKAGFKFEGIFIKARFNPFLKKFVDEGQMYILKNK